MKSIQSNHMKNQINRTIAFFLCLFAVIGCKDKVSDFSENTPVVQPVTDCTISDDTAPNMQGKLTFIQSGSRLSAPEVNWDNAQEECELSHYEIAIGTIPGGRDVLNFINIGQGNSYQQKNINLVYDEEYFYSVRAVDSSGCLLYTSPSPRD